MGKYNIARQAPDVYTIRCVRIACRMIKVTDIHSEFVMPIAFPLQQWLHEPTQLLPEFVIPIVFPL